MMPPPLAAAAPTRCEDCPLRRSAICLVVGHGDPDKLEAARTRQFSLRAKRLFVREGDRPHEVYRVRTGWGARFKILANGSRQILSFDLPGDFLSPELLHDTPVRFSKLSLTSMTLCAFPSESTASAISAGPTEADFIEQNWSRRVHDLERRVMMLGRMQAAGRIAGLVLDIYERLSARGEAADNECEFPLRHEDLADALGLTPAHVSRTLTSLRESGLLTIDAGRAAILDSEGLRQLAS